MSTTQERRTTTVNGFTLDQVRNAAGEWVTADTTPEHAEHVKAAIGCKACTEEGMARAARNSRPERSSYNRLPLADAKPRQS